MTLPGKGLYDGSESVFQCCWTAYVGDSYLYDFLDYSKRTGPSSMPIQASCCFFLLAFTAALERIRDESLSFDHARSVLNYLRYGQICQNHPLLVALLCGDQDKKSCPNVIGQLSSLLLQGGSCVFTTQDMRLLEEREEYGYSGFAHGIHEDLIRLHSPSDQIAQKYIGLYDIGSPY